MSTITPCNKCYYGCLLFNSNAKVHLFSNTAQKIFKPSGLIPMKDTADSGTLVESADILNGQAIQ